MNSTIGNSNIDNTKTNKYSNLPKCSIKWTYPKDIFNTFAYEFNRPLENTQNYGKLATSPYVMNLKKLKSRFNSEPRMREYERAKFLSGLNYEAFPQIRKKLLCTKGLYKDPKFNKRNLFCSKYEPGYKCNIQLMNNFKQINEDISYDEEGENQIKILPKLKEENPIPKFISKKIDRINII